jgi:hypothetical protein
MTANNLGNDAHRALPAQSGRQLREDRQLSVQRHALNPTDAEPEGRIRTSKLGPS